MNLVGRFPVMVVRANHIILIALLVPILTAGLAFSLVWSSVAAFLPLGLLGALLIYRSPEFRCSFVIIGGLVTLQSSDALSTPKLLYLAGTAMVLAVAIARGAIPVLFNDLAPLWSVPILWGLVTLLSFPISQANSVLFEDWLRDVVPYLLFAIHPIIAADVWKLGSRRFLLPLLVISGLIATISTSINWMTIRGLATLPIDRLFLSSYMMSTALFCFSTGLALFGDRRRAYWIFLASLSVSLILITGTRTSIVVAAVPLIIILLGPTQGIKRIVLSLQSVTVGVVALAIGLVVCIVSLGIEPSDLVARLTSIVDATDATTAAGQSYGLRVAQTDVARDAFYSNPLFGIGPGHYYAVIGSVGTLVQTTSLDSPLAIPAKFGLLGIFALLGALASYIVFLKRLDRKALTPSSLSLKAFLVIVSITCLVYSPLEDKGISFSLIVLSLASLHQAIPVEQFERGSPN